MTKSFIRTRPHKKKRDKMARRLARRATHKRMPSRRSKARTLGKWWLAGSGYR